jgi:hypothetical protein
VRPRPHPWGWRGVRMGRPGAMLFILWLIAVVLVVFGIVRIVQGELLLGLLLIVVGLLVGPGGVSIFSMLPAFV